jgi:hypothetical protein
VSSIRFINDCGMMPNARLWTEVISDRCRPIWGGSKHITKVLVLAGLAYSVVTWQVLSHSGSDIAKDQQLKSTEIMGYDTAVNTTLHSDNNGEKRQ